MRTGCFKARPSAKSDRDFSDILKWSLREFGESAALRYKVLLEQALADIQVAPFRPGSQDRSDLAPGVRTYHVRFSRRRARVVAGPVRNPRHFLVYRVREDDGEIDVLRILHESCDLPRYFPG